MNEWNKGHCNQDIRVLIKFQSGEIKIAKWVGSTDVCNYNSWQTDKGYWYPADLVMGWMLLPK